ncbi:MAG TPA: LacI family transcriptional regulator [Ruminococcaceae bacterium]|jgi:ribose transport system substrate-binding protein|nr:LacI family transcriptional regulator [Oscillospiraceae bacterium]
MKKRIMSLLLASLTAASCAACSSNTPAAAPAGSAAASDGSSQETAKSSYNVTVIIKATESSYWQTLLLGAKAAADESGGKIKVTTAGPASESDMEKQVTILENTVAAKPDGIVLASISSTATVPAVEQAVKAGIPVVTVDNKLGTDAYAEHIATDHAAAAATAADEMAKQWKAKGIDPSGKKVAVISSDSSSPVNQARCKGFADEIKKQVPGISVLPTRFCNGDMQKALDETDNLLMANKDLIGIFGDNNLMGDGIAKSIEQNKAGDKVVSYAFDSDDTEIQAIQNGHLTGIIVQDPYGMGYNGVLAVASAAEGKSVEHDVVSKTTLVTKDNMSDSAVQKLLYPDKN